MNTDPSPEDPAGDDAASAHGADDTEAFDSTEVTEDKPDIELRYEFSVTDVQDAATILDSVFANPLNDPSGWSAVEEAIDADGQVSKPLARQLSQICSYSLEFDDSSADSRFEADLPWLPKPRDVSPDVCRLWTELTARVSSPGAVARLEELLLARREGNLRDHARRAGTAYIQSIESQTDDFTTTQYLARAWTISRKFSLDDLEGQTLLELQRRVEDPRRSATIGVLMSMLAILAQRPRNTALEPTLHRTAKRILTELAALPLASHIVEEIGSLRIQLVPPGDKAAAMKREIRADQLAALRAASESTKDPMIKHIHLSIASDFARRHQFHDEDREIRRQIQAVSSAGFPWERSVTSFQIPTWLVESQMRRFTCGRSWREGMKYFFNTHPPTGNVGALRKSAAERPHGFSDLMPITLYGPDDLPRKTLSSDEERTKYAMSQRALVMAQHRGNVLAQGLQRLAEKYGPPNVNDLAAFLIECYECEPASAHVLAKAFKHFWHEDYLESVYLAALATEDAARRLLRELDEGIYRLQVGNNPGKYPSLGNLLYELKSVGLDESWHYYLDWLLLGPIGQNIRNDVAHGFTKDADPVNAALVLRAASVLITVTTSIVRDHKKIITSDSQKRRSGMSGLADRLVSTMARTFLSAYLHLEGRRGRYG